jgi:hypothetical protein
MWPGVETSRGNYSISYLETMQTIVEKLGNKGIFTLVDCHQVCCIHSFLKYNICSQDLLSRKFCGEGAPDYAAQVNKEDFVLPFPLPSLFYEFTIDPKTGYPALNECMQVKFYTLLKFNYDSV